MRIILQNKNKKSKNRKEEKRRSNKRGVKRETRTE